VSKKKRLLVLAGTHFQVPAIEYAKKVGHYVMTCDNKPNNPGHRLADEYFNISTTDLDGILGVAIQKEIDGILAYGSDPAALTAAYVSEKLNIPGNSFKSVQTLSDKGLFRKFLTDNEFPAPKYIVFNSIDEARKTSWMNKKDVYVKPVDSSGSKGITKLSPNDNLEFSFDYALKYSRKGEVIIEEEIPRKGPHIHGEAFIYNGEIRFILLGDQYFSPVTAYAPMSTTVPSICHSDIMQKIESQLSKIINLSRFNTGGLNIEIIRDKKDNIYFIEIGARSGGNFMPELAQQASKFNLAPANVNAVLDEKIDFSYSIDRNHYYSQLILHSHKNGILIGDTLNKYKDFLSYKSANFIDLNNIKTYKDSQDVIRIHLYKFTDRAICEDFIDYIKHNNIVEIK
jgi:biotin carboxylase